MGRLDGLTGYLEKYEGDAVILNFDEIEALMGARLPRSARKANSPFWASHERNVYAKAWLDAGFVALFDECGPDEVNFTRRDVLASAAEEADAAVAAQPREPVVDLTALPPPPVDVATLPPPPVSVEDRAAATVLELTTAFTAGSFLVSARGSVAAGWEALPDVIAVRALEARDADPVWSRLLLTFGTVLDRGREDGERWERVVGAFDAEVSLFDPDAVAGLELRELAASLARHELTIRPGEVAAWRLAAEALTGEAAAAPQLQQAIYDGSVDAALLLAELTAEPLIPGLSSRGVVIRLLRMFAFPGRVSVAGLADLPVVVDANVRRATEFLDLSATVGLPLAKAAPRIEGLWAAAAAVQPPVGPPELAGTQVALDVALSFHGRVGCRWCREKLVIEPITPACEHCRLRG